MLYGKIKIALNEFDEIVLKGERDNKTLYEIKLEDDDYQHDYITQAKELMGQAMEILANNLNPEEFAEIVEEELDNWGNYYIEKR